MLWRPGRPQRRSRSEERLPPGQRLVRGWPVLHEGPEPDFDPEGWRLRIWGEVEAPYELCWAELNQEPQVELVRDWHCVTTWSRFDQRWGGVAVDPLLARARPLERARHALIHCYDAIGYTTNLRLDDLLGHDNLLCTQAEGMPLSREHGGPIRLVVHHLYAWKSAKWVKGIELLSEDQRGFWEERGYHNRADPWLEERYSYQEGEE